MSEKTAIVAKKPKKEMVLAPRQDDAGSVNALISQAVAANVPIETLERLFTLRERVKAEQAKEAFVKALAGFQGELKTIVKTKKVMGKDGKLRYMFAPMDSIIEQIKGPEAKYGFAHTWTVDSTVSGYITAICKITHELGHSETTDFKVPIMANEFMNAPQHVASALTFAKRYSLCNALGIATGDEDVDANLGAKDKMPPSQKAKIVILLRALGQTSLKTEADYARAVELFTQLRLEDANHGEIVSRLTILVKEKEGYEAESHDD